ncbi:histidine kinase [Nonomuraea sp. NPDC050451]|uniref:histidine kinase n=1 Tax=Nonomuraea sp. NPDC050451 TaxID=3364364 RepID=UPI0037944EF4
MSLCTHRRRRQIVPIAFLFWACMGVYAVSGGTTQQADVSLTTSTTILGGLTFLGLYLRSLRDADLAAERTELQRIEQAELAERAKIAQEMHDALAHRMTLVAMLAGGLAYRTDLRPEEMRQTAQAIQENAHQSRNELGTLHAGGATAADLSRPAGPVPRSTGRRAEGRRGRRHRTALPAAHADWAQRVPSRSRGAHQRA